MLKRPLWLGVPTRALEVRSLLMLDKRLFVLKPSVAVVCAKRHGWRWQSWLCADTSVALTYVVDLQQKMISSWCFFFLPILNCQQAKIGGRWSRQVENTERSFFAVVSQVMNFRSQSILQPGW